MALDLQKHPPAQPGEVRNPAGHNQYTYRRRFIEAMAELADGSTGLQSEPYQGPRVCFLCSLSGPTLKLAELGACHEHCVAEARALTRGQLFARVLWTRALAGEEWASKLLAAHLAPARLLVELGLGDPRASADDAGRTTADRFDQLPADERAIVGRSLSAVIQGKPELAGEAAPIADAELPTSGPDPADQSLVLPIPPSSSRKVSAPATREPAAGSWEAATNENDG